MKLEGWRPGGGTVGWEMRFPAIKGMIRRRLLINYRADPEVVGRILPQGMKPKTVKGSAMVGICLIRLEGMRPRAMGFLPPLASENAAHRFAVQVEGRGEGGEAEEAVYIPRRDTDSTMSHWVGGRLFPGEHHLAGFEISDEEGRIDFRMTSRDGEASIRVCAVEGAALPGGSCFGDLETASAFYEAGSRGYSDNQRRNCYDCIDLMVERWSVTALNVKELHSRFFEGPGRFPEGSVEFDHALLMRDIEHEWRSAPDLAMKEEFDGAGVA
jgi:hypothetical protein